MEGLPEGSWSVIAKSASVASSVCDTCMSSHRTLYPIKETMVLASVCNGIQLSPEDLICWECKALLEKFDLFRTKALESKATLTMWTQMDQQACPTFLPSLSTLTCSYKTGYDFEVDSDVIKTEPSYPEVDFVVANKDEGEDFEDLPDGDIKTEPPEKQEVTTEAEEGFYVVVMSETEMLGYRESERDSVAYRRAGSKCDRCVKHFRNQALLDKHEALHDEREGAFVCPVCGVRFAGEDFLTLHVTSHYRCLECRDCGYRNTDRTIMLRHWRRHRKPSKKCTLCDRHYTSVEQLRNHFLVAHDGLDGGAELTAKQLMRAVTGSEGAGPTAKQPMRVAGGVACAHCGKTFSNKYLRKRHEALIHAADVPQLGCDVCGKVFRGAGRLKAHKRVHEDKANENAFCAECGVQYKNIYLYHVHLKTAARHVRPDDRKFECSECGKRFVSKTYLRLHIELVHLRRADHVCDVCGQGFNARLMLSRHKREKHSGRARARILCDVCGKAFTVRKCLEEHMNQHTGARPFRCGACAATFAYSAALYNHTRLVHLKLGRKRKRATD